MSNGTSDESFDGYIKCQQEFEMFIKLRGEFQEFLEYRGEFREFLTSREEFQEFLIKRIDDEKRKERLEIARIIGTTIQYMYKTQSKNKTIDLLRNKWPWIEDGNEYVERGFLEYKKYNKIT